MRCQLLSTSLSLCEQVHKVVVMDNLTWSYVGPLDQPQPTSQPDSGEDQTSDSEGPLTQTLVIAVSCLTFALALLCVLLCCVCTSSRRRRRNHFYSRCEPRDGRVLSRSV